MAALRWFAGRVITAVTIGRNHRSMSMDISVTRDGPSKSRLRFRPALLLAGMTILLPPTTAVVAETTGEGDFANYEQEKRISAYDAKRRARVHLCTLGYCARSGPGGARVKSITRDGDVWIVSVRVSNGGAVMSVKHTLYIDAVSGAVSDIRPESRPARIASE